MSDWGNLHLIVCFQWNLKHILPLGSLRRVVIRVSVSILPTAMVSAGSSLQDIPELTPQMLRIVTKISLFFGGLNREIESKKVKILTTKIILDQQY